MSNPYAGADNFPATIPVLDDSDPPAAATWAPALEGLADRTAYLLARQFRGGLITIGHQENTPASETTVISASIDDSGLYAQIGSGIDLSFTEDDDFLVVGARLVLTQTGTGTGTVGVQIVHDGVVIPGARNERASVQNQVHEFSILAVKQIVTAAPPEEIRWQAVSTGLDVDWVGSFSLWAAVFRINV